ncbi:MAG TPA: alkaline phosphatase family protein, partial [Acidimicrobiales bacterium]|nr:alkaline phosphatase family protein [Acidimicrobiales bacterium]
MTLSRRQFLTAAGAAGALAASGGLTRAVGAASRSWPRPRPEHATPLAANGLRSPIEHIVVLCMENRSFDHYLGWVPGANGRQAGLSYADGAGLLHDTHRLNDWAGCGYNDPDHSYDGGRTQYDGGKVDGFRKGSNDDYALGYYTRDQVPTNAALVDGFAIADNYFSSILGPTYPNRFYSHAAATDRISNTSTTSTLPTIWDSLATAGVSANYYFSDLPFLALWGTKYVNIARSIGHFFADAAAGSLPSYSYIDPFFLGEDQGGSNDDHPHADIRRGQALISNIVNALMLSPVWSSTVLVVTYDEWGGFFDHVVPKSFPDAFTPTPTEEHNTSGFRVPAYVVSPFAAPGTIGHNVYNHASILKLVEWRWDLRPLNVRDAAAGNLAEMLDFSGVNPTPEVPLV